MRILSLDRSTTCSPFFFVAAAPAKMWLLLAKKFLPTKLVVFFLTELDA